MRASPSLAKFLLIITVGMLVPWLVLVFTVLFYQQWTSGHYFANQLEQGTNIIDFLQFYSAGKQIYAGHAQQVYDVQAQLQCMNELIQPLAGNKCFVMQYVPTLLPFLSFLAMAPLIPAYALWIAISVGAGLCALCLLCRKEGLSSGQILLCLFLVLASFPSVFAIRLGQSAWFLLTFSSIYLFALKNNRPYWAGIALVLTTIKPQYAAILATPALANKKWKLIAVACAGEIILIAVAMLVLGVNNILEFPAFVSDAETNPAYWGVFPTKMICLRSLLSGQFSEILVLRICLLLWLLASGIILIWWRQSYKQGLSNNKFWLLCSITTLAAVIFSPHSHAYDLLLCAAPFTMLATHLTAISNKAKSAVPKQLSWQGNVVLTILLTFPLTSYWLYMLPEQTHALLFLLLVLFLFLGKIANQATQRNDSK